MNPGVSIIVRRAGATKDRYGNRNQDWSNPVDSQPLEGWLDLKPMKADESDRNRTDATAEGIAYLPAEADVKASDRLVIDGVVYQLHGLPSPIYRPGYGIHHYECRISRAEG